MDDVTFQRLRTELERLLGLDLQAYKQQQMRRRIDTFINKHVNGDVQELLRRLRTDRALFDALRDMLTINVTDFFRDGAQWALFERKVLPALLAERQNISIWSAGCSHGQEPVTIAIALDRADALRRARILATDFDRAALARARAGGPYRAGEMSGVTAIDRTRYFARQEDGFVASEALRRHMRFKELNLLRDPFEHDFDLVVCRNVMIYFTSDVKRVLIRRFYDSLRPGGTLFIGGSEALIGRDTAGFERLGGNFYRRIPLPGERALSTARAAS